MFRILTEEEVDTLYRVAKIVAPKFRFGYLDIEDIIQEGVLFALQAIEDGKWDESRPLEPFARTLMHNELFNYKRNNFCRIEPPCLCCGPDSVEPCPKYAKWRQRNFAKMGLAQTNSSEHETESNSSPAEETAVSVEMFALIDSIIPADLRADYLRLRNGVSVTKSRRDKIRELVGGVLNAD